MNKKLKKITMLNALALAMLSAHSYAQPPKFSIVPVPAGSNTTQANKGDIFSITYKVTNNLSDSKTLTMKPMSGVLQLPRGAQYCDTLFRLAPGKSCLLRLQINTSKKAVGSKIQDGPEVCIGESSLSCSRPSPQNLLDINVLAAPSAPLTASSYDVVTTTSAILTAGQANRTVVIKNTGKVSANSISYKTVNLPSDTTVDSSGCTTIPAGGSCTITIIPGTIPNSSAALSPAPAILNIVGLNTNKLTLDLSVLTYGNIYQGGYFYKAIKTISSKNIGGSIAALTDLNNSKSYPWKPVGAVKTVSNAASIIDGQTNSRSILAVYKTGNYAAYECSQLRVNETGDACIAGVSCFTNWHLPAICEIGTGKTYSADCSAYANNMMSNLYNKGIGNFKTNTSYWASTAYTTGADTEGWQMSPFEAIPYGNTSPGNYWNFPVRCTRTLTY